MTAILDGAFLTELGGFLRPGDYRVGSRGQELTHQSLVVVDIRAAAQINLVRDEGSVKVTLARQLQLRVGGIHCAVEVAASC